MEDARSAGIAAGLALALLVVPLANLPATRAEESSTPAEPALEAKEPAVASEPLPRGDVEWVGPPISVDTGPISVDGNLSEWQAQPTRLGGTTILEAGELVYQGFLFDDHGADDGKDARRIATMGPAYEREDRSQRVEAVSQAGDEQFGAPDPTGGVLVSPAHYGNAEVPDPLQGHADLFETRLTVRGDGVYVSARTAAMTDASAPALLVLADTEPTAEADTPREVPFDSGIETTRAETALLITQQGVRAADLVAGETTPLASAEVALDPSGYRNAIEARLPLASVAALDPAEGSDRIEVALGAGLHDGEGHLVDVATGEAEADVLDVAFRQEAQVSNWMDRGQALDLLEDRMPHFTQAAVADLRNGRTYEWQPTPGYHERVFESSANISSESDREGLHQHYGLYLPSDWEPGQESPLTFWLHWRGGTAHQAAA